MLGFMEDVTNYCESIYHICSNESRTKVRGSKMIRYHRSLYHKLCRLGIGGYHYRYQAPQDKGVSWYHLQSKDITGSA